MQRWPVVVPSSPAVPQQQHGPNAVQMSEPSSFNISLTLHQSYQVSPRFRLDKISQDWRKKIQKKKDQCLQLDFAALWNQHHHVEAARSLKDLFTRSGAMINPTTKIQQHAQFMLCVSGCWCTVVHTSSQLLPFCPPSSTEQPQTLL